MTLNNYQKPSIRTHLFILSLALLLLIIVYPGHSLAATYGCLSTDNSVDSTDLASLVSAWGTPNASDASTDLNGDGTVNVLDLSILLSNWGGNCRDNATGFWATNSFFNTPLPANVTINPSTSTWLSDIESYAGGAGGANNGYGLYNNFNNWSIPAYSATNSTPTITIAISNLSGKTLTIPYQQGWQPDPQSDESIAIIDTSTGCSYEFEEFNASNKTANAFASYHIYTGSGAHLPDAAYSGGELPGLGGLITPEDVNSGSINHAIEYATESNSPDFVVPGTRSDGTNAGGIPEGQLMRLDPSVNLSSYNLDAFQMMVAKALQTYGGYDDGSSGSFATYTEDQIDGSTYNIAIDSTALPASLISHLQFINFPFSTPTYDSNTNTSCNQAQ